MSSWRVGTDVATERAPTTMKLTVDPAAFAVGATSGEVTATVVPAATPSQTTADLVKAAADVYTKWIPGDVLAVYLALTTAFRGTLASNATGSETPHAWGILIAGLALAAGLVLLGAVAANLKTPTTDKRALVTEIVGRMILSVLAFGFWSLTVPGSWWEVKDWDPGVLAALSLGISVVFALVAEVTVGLIQRLKA